MIEIDKIPHTCRLSQHLSRVAGKLRREPSLKKGGAYPPRDHADCPSPDFGG